MLPLSLDLGPPRDRRRSRRTLQRRTWAKSSATSVACSFNPARDCEPELMALIDIQVPDIGDFDEVAVIELLVKPATPSRPSKA
jgi:hypothetical protein